MVNLGKGFRGDQVLSWAPSVGHFRRIYAPVRVVPTLGGRGVPRVVREVLSFLLLPKIPV